jgi:hypothetical protein
MDAKLSELLKTLHDSTQIKCDKNSSPDVLNELMDHRQTLKNYTAKINGILECIAGYERECDIRITEMCSDIDMRAPLGNWADICSDDEPVEIAAPRAVPQATFHELEVANIKLTLPVINSLQELRPALAWDATRSGIYICISDGFYVKVPFPDLAESLSAGARVRTIACKHKSKVHSRACNFAHAGDQLMRVGITARCPKNPRLGAHATLQHDLRNTTENDLRTVLTYALSDVLLATMWHQHTTTQFPLVIENIDTC